MCTCILLYTLAQICHLTRTGGSRIHRYVAWTSLMVDENSAKVLTMMLWSTSGWRYLEIEDTSIFALEIQSIIFETSAQLFQPPSSWLKKTVDPMCFNQLRRLHLRWQCCPETGVRMVKMVFVWNGPGKRTRRRLIRKRWSNDLALK